MLRPSASTAAPPSTSLAIALALAAAGWPSFPCRPNKRPACAHGFRDASRDPLRICELWHLAGPAAQLVGVPTGEATFDVLDIDPRHHGDLWEHANRARLGETRMHGTPSGGRHYLFQHADGVRNSAGKIAPGVDTRGSGGYICMPPSAGYQVINQAAIAAWPNWLLPLVLKAADPTTGNGSGNGTSRTEKLLGAEPAAITDKRIAGQIEALLDNVRRAADGTKHYTPLRNGHALGGYIARAGWTDEQAVEALIQALPATVKDWNLARRTAGYAVASGRKKPSTLPDRPFERRRSA